jgi:hypothetical protein
MSRHSRTNLVPPKPEPDTQALETLEKMPTEEKTKESVLTELDNEIECPRCK